jgi:hypothetical protein
MSQGKGTREGGEERSKDKATSAHYGAAISNRYIHEYISDCYRRETRELLLQSKRPHSNFDIKSHLDELTDLKPDIGKINLDELTAQDKPDGVRKPNLNEPTAEDKPDDARKPNLDEVSAKDKTDGSRKPNLDELSAQYKPDGARKPNLDELSAQYKPDGARKPNLDELSAQYKPCPHQEYLGSPK